MDIINFAITWYLAVMLLIGLSVLQARHLHNVTCGKLDWLLLMLIPHDRALQSNVTAAVRTEVLIDATGLHWSCLEMLAFQ